MEDIQCIFCNKSSDQIEIEENGYKSRKCPGCGLIYISPRPSFSEIQNLYGQDEAHISAESHISRAFKKRLYARHNLGIIKKFIKNGSMLEIGAGSGYFLDEARKEGFDVYGIELNSIQADFIRSKLGIPCEDSPLNNSSFDGKKFDIIYHCDVISHFYDPIAEFKKMNEKLNDNGILVFETGNLEDVEKKYYNLFTTFQYPDHLFFFSEGNLKILLERTGFEFMKIYRYSIVPQLWIIKILLKIKYSIKIPEKSKKTGKNIITEAQSFTISSRFKQLIENACHYFFYLIRYKVGCIIPKKGRPQTVIVAARKR